ncbi:redoxin domain-containing protein [Schlesneria paludicola]|uniref:redoxin domain-containing protein n=1 Tax=Schlesneria paludicola TaxID=360056 RepID=UPI00029AF6C9|nr:redoxin domain-containing protein [Schlesneria paludicola]
MTSQSRWYCGLVVGCSIFAPAVSYAEPTVAQVLARTPIQKDVEYETPKKDEIAKCKLEAERKGKSVGWVVTGPSGQVLRRFLDTDGDGTLDQYRFYNHGIEVYRDIDSNNNQKVDQYRWLNLAGTRWGIDQNEDGRIDQWKVLSAAEASKEAIRAMVTGDQAAWPALMINADDVKTLGLNPQLAAKLLESAADPAKKAKAILDKSKTVSPQTKWTRFDAQMPSTIPFDDEKANADLNVYESAMAIIETPGKKDPFAAVQIGEMIRVGEVWKITQVPLPIEGDVITTSGGVLMEPLIASGNSATSLPGPSPKVANILKELQDIEQRLLQPSQSAAQVKTLMSKRAVLLKDAIELADSDDDRTILTKQMVDGYALAAQMGTYPEGVKELKAIEADITKKSPKSPLIPYTNYRLLQAEYYVNAQELDGKEDKKEKQGEVQKQWLQALQEFVTKYPTADDTDDAMMTLGNNEEMQGRTKESVVWYQRIVQERPKSTLAARAQGAIKRLDLNGKVLDLEGPMLAGGSLDLKKLRGKVVLVVFWNSEYKMCEEDIPALRALYQENRAKGFEIVGVALEHDKASAQSYVDKHRMTWPQIFQPVPANQAGGLNSPMATSYGIILFPTMFLVNADGKVESRNATMTDVKQELPELLKAANVAQNPQAKGSQPKK